MDIAQYKMKLSQVSFVIPSSAIGEKLTGLLREFCAISVRDLEVLVVLNGAEAQAVAAIESEFGDKHCCRLIRIPETGLTAARIAGAKASSREIVWFLDDDVRLPAGFLMAVEHLEFPQACGFGGGPLVLPDWINLPGWANNTLMLHDLSISTQPLSASRLPIGANCFCRRSAFLAIVPTLQSAPFMLDRQGSSLLSSGDAYCWILLQKQGWKNQWCASVTVYHDIRVDRIDRTWFRRRAYWQGISTLCLARNLSVMRFLFLSFSWVAYWIWLACRVEWAKLVRRIDVPWRVERLQLVTGSVFAGFWPILLGSLPAQNMSESQK